MIVLLAGGMRDCFVVRGTCADGGICVTPSWGQVENTLAGFDINASLSLQLSSL